MSFAFSIKLWKCYCDLKLSYCVSPYAKSRNLHSLYQWKVAPSLFLVDISGSMQTSMCTSRLRLHKRAFWIVKKKVSSIKTRRKKPGTYNWLFGKILKMMMMMMLAYPVVQASLSMLTESAVITNASAQASCPMCGFGSTRFHVFMQPINIIYSCSVEVSKCVGQVYYVTVKQVILVWVRLGCPGTLFVQKL